MGAFVFSILGPLEVRYQGELVPVRGARERAVLAVLLLADGRLVPLAKLIEAVWDSEPPPAAEKAIRNAVSALRGRLGRAETSAAVIETDPAGYRLRLGEGSRVDAAEFRRRTASGCELASAGQAADAVAELRAGLGLWRGPALAGIGGLVIEAAAAGLDEQRLAAAEDCVESELRLGRHREVIGELQALAAEQPLRERVAGQLMLALYRSSRQAEALDAYHQLARKLADELGIDPSAEITRLHEAILRQDEALDLGTALTSEPDRDSGALADDADTAEPPGTQVRPAQLPLDVPGFAGRIAELARLHALLPPGDAASDGGTVVISAIGGTAGVGKTALAVRFAHQVADRFPDGQLYINLNGFGPSAAAVTPATALRGFLHALGVAPEAIPADEGDQAALYRTLLAGRRVLVLLDNARDAGQVRPLLPASPGCLVIVTSRSELTGLVAAQGARPLTLDVLAAHEAAALLDSRLGRDRVDREPGAAETLTRLCSGLPLALAIVAARAAARPGLTLTDLAAELLNAQSRLDALDTGDPATSVRAVFSWSYQQLSEAAARMFRLLGLHPGRDVTIPAAASLAGVSVQQAHRLLTELARSYLLAEQTSGRYTFHDLLRAYATDRANAPDVADDPRAALTRLFDHYLTTAAAAMDRLHPVGGPPRPRIPPTALPMPDLPTPQAALSWLDADRPVLVAVSEYAAAHGWHRHAMNISGTLYWYLRGGYPVEGMAIHVSARDAARQAGDLDAEGDALHRLGGVYWRLGRYPEGARHFESALGLHERTGNRVGQAHDLNALGIIQWHLGDHAAGIRYQEQALELFRQAGDRFGQSVVLGNLGNGVLQLGRHQEAARYLQDALTLARQDGDREGEAYALSNLADIEQRSGRTVQAAGLYRDALAIFIELRHRTGQGLALSNLGNAVTVLGHPDRAAEYHQQALALFRATSDRGEEPFALNGLGEAAQAAGRPADAMRHHKAALSVAADTGNLEQQARAHAGLGHAYEVLGEAARAREHFGRALDLYTTLGYSQAEQMRARLAAADPSRSSAPVGAS
jgi:DNA-binding SARP family transcriptional activator/Tfp pilus assembly protein PilF